MDQFTMRGRTPITLDPFVRGALGPLLVAGIGALIYHPRAALVPFFVAWVAAYLLYPIVRFLQKYCFIRNRLAAIALTLLLTCGTLGGLFYRIVPPMVEECAHRKDVALNYSHRGADNTAVPKYVQDYLQHHVNEYQIENLLRQEDFMAAVKTTVPKVWEVLWSTASLIFNVVASLIGLLYLLFLLTDYEKYANRWISFVPRHKRRFAARLVADIEHGMAGYFRGQALVALSNCFMFSIGFLIIGFPMPIGLGCLIGLISFVPYLQVVGFLPAALLALLKSAETGQNFWWLLLLVLIVYLVVQVLQDTIFTPRIMGKIMGLPPAIILLSLSVWGYALGIIGLILALPVTTLAISYYKRYVVGDSDILDDKLDPETIAVAKEAGIYVEKPVTHDTMPDKQPESTVSPAPHTDEQQEIPHFTTTVKEGGSEKRTE